MLIEDIELDYQKTLEHTKRHFEKQRYIGKSVETREESIEPSKLLHKSRSQK